MRSLIALTVAFFLLILQSTVLELAPVRMAAPSLGLLVVLHVGLSPKWSISSAALVSFATGYLLDLVSGAPQGVHSFVFVLMVLFARALSVRVAVTGIVLSAATAFVASLLSAAAGGAGARAGLARGRLRRPSPGAARGAAHRILRSARCWGCCAGSTAAST